MQYDKADNNMPFSNLYDNIAVFLHYIYISSPELSSVLYLCFIYQNFSITEREEYNNLESGSSASASARTTTTYYIYNSITFE